MSVPQLRPALTDEMQSLLAQKEALFAASDNEEAALGIALPKAVEQATQSFAEVLRQETDVSRIFVAHKATDRLENIAAAGAHAGIDVASLAELRNAVKAGYELNNVIATGPKSTAFLRELAQHPELTIVIDSLGELERLLEIESKNPLVLRITSSVKLPEGSRKSRFGLDQKQLWQALDMLLPVSKRVRGLAVHIDTKSLRERVTMAHGVFELLLDVQMQGFHNAEVLDIGGGYGENYGLSAKQYEQFDASIRDMLNSSNKLSTWRRRAYGLIKGHGIISGQYSGVDMPVHPLGATRLQEIVQSRYIRQSFGRALSDSLCELWIEPGSAIFADAGVVASQIIDISQRDGEWFVVVNAQRNQVTFDGNEIVSDPIHIARDMSESSEPCECFIAGQLCMESDFMTYRKIRFDTTPRVGDLLVWTHTGAYRMHMSQSLAIGHPHLARYTYKNNVVQKDEL